jgi:hypothetical protein
MQCNFLGREFGVAGVSRKLPFFFVCECTINSIIALGKILTVNNLIKRNIVHCILVSKL